MSASTVPMLAISDNGNNRPSSTASASKAKSDTTTSDATGTADCTKTSTGASAAPKRLEMTIPSELDVLCGRGRVSFDHSGTRRFRRIVASHIQDYLVANRKQKTIIVRTILYEVVGRGGKFLKRIGNEGWYDAGLRAGREKAGHALRDAANRRTRGIRGDSDEIYPCPTQSRNNAAVAAAAAAFQGDNGMWRHTNNNNNNNNHKSCSSNNKCNLPTNICNGMASAAGTSQSPSFVFPNNTHSAASPEMVPMNSAVSARSSIAAPVPTAISVPSSSVNSVAAAAAPVVVPDEEDTNLQTTRNLFLGPDVAYNNDDLLLFQQFCQNNGNMNMNMNGGGNNNNNCNSNDRAMISPESTMGSQLVPVNDGSNNGCNNNNNNNNNNSFNSIMMSMMASAPPALTQQDRLVRDVTNDDTEPNDFCFPSNGNNHGNTPVLFGGVSAREVASAPSFQNNPNVGGINKHINEQQEEDDDRSDEGSSVMDNMSTIFSDKSDTCSFSISSQHFLSDGEGWDL